MTKKTNERSLEQTVEKVRNRLTGKKQVFPVYRFPEEKVVDWEGDDIDEFLNLCEQSQGPLVYMCQIRPQQINVDDDEFFSDHIGELSQLEVAFLQDGYFHRFKEATDWWKTYWENQEEESPFGENERSSRLSKKEAAQIKACINRLGEEEITEEFIKELRKSDHPDYFFEPRLYHLIRKKFGLPSSEHFDLHAIDEGTYEAFSAFSHAAEAKMVESLLPDFIEWSRRNANGKPLKADTGVFLNEIRIKLSKESVTTLWRKGTNALKQGTT